MFTGIIQALGTIKSLEQTGGDLRAVIVSDDLDFSDVAIGDSICVSGVCLTAIALDGHGFTVDISNETIDLTSFASLEEGARVNLEKAMQPSSRFGGHIVSGHVDGLAELVSRSEEGRSERLVFEVSSSLARYIAAKGSVCLEGISLTVNAVEGNQFGVNIIPHTADVTTFSTLKPGQKVNLEVDIISRYLERLLADRNLAGAGEGITLDKLEQYGFVGQHDDSQ